MSPNIIAELENPVTIISSGTSLLLILVILIVGPAKIFVEMLHRLKNADTPIGTFDFSRQEDLRAPVLNVRGCSDTDCCNAIRAMPGDLMQVKAAVTEIRDDFKQVKEDLYSRVHLNEVEISGVKRYMEGVANGKKK